MRSRHTARRCTIRRKQVAANRDIVYIERKQVATNSEMEERVDLTRLVSAALGGPSTALYLDRLSGQLLPAAEVAARCGAAVAVQERYVRVPPIHSRLRLDDARDFATALPDGVLRKRLDKLLRGPRAPWAFERELARWPDVASAWQTWEQRCATARVLGWLGRLGVPFAYPD